eukprot:SAG25_NODE_3132_length_1203_cov_1.230072_1_plen_77_part_10
MSSKPGGTHSSCPTVPERKQMLSRHSNERAVWAAENLPPSVADTVSSPPGRYGVFWELPFSWKAFSAGSRRKDDESA